MDGDFTAFTDILNKKLMGEKKQLTESQQKQVDTIDQVGQYTVMATQALQKLSQMKLDKELANIKKEKDSQLASWKEKYDKGLIDKDTYEKGVDKINKQADQKTKAAQLDAFKRQQKVDIAMAIINGAQAALKSLAMFGWPLGLIGVAGAAVATGIQIAMIKSQQPPSMAKGGKIRNAGVPDGPRHGSNYGESGISLVRRDTGEEVGEMEGKEPIMVLSRNTYANNRAVVDKLLHSSLHRNGAPIMLNGGLFGSDGGSYGDYLAKGGLRRFDTGGWMDQVNEEYDSGGYSGSGSGDTGDVASPVEGSTDTSAADSMNGITNEEIQKSQALMEDIKKNTSDMALILVKVNDTLTAIGQQQRLDSYDASYNNWSLRDILKTGLASITTSNTLQSLLLRNSIHTDLTALQTTMKFELPSLGKELTDEFTMLRFALTLGLLSLKTGFSQDVKGLSDVTKTGLNDLLKSNHDDLGKLLTAQKTDLTNLQKGMHQDMLALEKLLHDDLTHLEDSLHDDLTTLDDHLERNLATFQKSVHTDLDSLKLAQALQMLGLKTQTHQDATDLMNAISLALANLQKNTHNDLASLQNSNQSELRTVQTILSSTKNEQSYQSGLLNRIADKNLTVSVQNVINVNNQINVVADKSDLK